MKISTNPILTTYIELIKSDSTEFTFKQTSNVIENVIKDFILYPENYSYTESESYELNLLYDNDINKLKDIILTLILVEIDSDAVDSLLSLAHYEYSKIKRDLYFDDWLRYFMDDFDNLNDYNETNPLVIKKFKELVTFGNQQSVYFKLLTNNNEISLTLENHMQMVFN